MVDSAVRVALVQADCPSEEPYDVRVARVLAQVDSVCRESDLVVLPELWSSAAFDIELARRYAEPLDGELVARMSAIARSNGVWLHGGSFAEIADTGQHFNTSVLFDPSGDIAATYRKIHVFGYGGEAEVMSPGQDLVIVETVLGVTALATCYDLRFPEQFRALTALGAEAFLVTSGWPTARIDAWDVLIRARAIENQAWMLACNQVGVQKGVLLGGHSAVVDPRGTVLAHGGRGESIVHASVDPGLPAQWRAEFPALRDIVAL